jgi:hypothetical protein
MPINSPDIFDSIGDAVVIGGAGGGGVTTFVALNDTPSSYSGNAGRMVVVNPGETELVFNTGFTLPVTDGTSGQVLKTDGAGVVNWSDNSFLTLSDVTDTTYTSKAGFVATVNAGESGIELVGSTDPGLALKTTVTGSSFGYLNGQTIAQTLYRPAISITPRAIGTTYSVESAVAISFKPENTVVRIDLQMYVLCAPGETISMAISDNSGTFSDVGSTDMQVFSNGGSGSHNIVSNINATFYVTGLTPATSYTWYPAIKSTSTLSGYVIGTGSPGITVEARHVAI